jgi:hypothetical protein
MLVQKQLDRLVMLIKFQHDAAQFGLLFQA